jgi:hypothetical protein
MLLYYFGIKGAFLFGLARSYVSFEPLQKHALFLSVLYTAGVAFLSWAVFMPLNPTATTRDWQIWLAKTFVLTLIYFKLLSRFDEGMIFWILFLGGGLGLIWF